MAQIILSDVSVLLANVAGLTNPGTGEVKSCTINFTPEAKENTGFGHTAKSRKVGLQDWSIDLEIYQNYDAASMDASLFTIMNGDGDVGAISIQPVSGAEGAGNPAYESTAGFLESYSPIAAGAVGELGVIKIRILAMGAELTVDRA